MTAKMESLDERIACLEAELEQAKQEQEAQQMLNESVEEDALGEQSVTENEEEESKADDEDDDEAGEESGSEDEVLEELAGQEGLEDDIVLGGDNYNFQHERNKDEEEKIQCEQISPTQQKRGAQRKKPSEAAAESNKPSRHKYKYECTVEGCTNRARCGGRCIRHGANELRLLRLRDQPPRCTIQGCRKKAQVRLFISQPLHHDIIPTKNNPCISSSYHVDCGYIHYF
mmetsp:Transcript_19574/g.33662  ORF Transcript_19574/g.33662 Transcript_19574/m.33662 type:complete len:229 (-) Transcript_19574:21-707(-)